MTVSLLNLPIYPISCRNPTCNETFNLDKAKAEILKSGIVYNKLMIVFHPDKVQGMY